ncbi:hypothetical protein BV22DRAFT_342350 [Leucogyrophana mollusca]|uniref:Uncharacterized protein n=1 Tax=Leucogyrophana mollusca TaxID=85980 RepID=A0ACB8BL67_9AGAM|nr:hypothetical protein BV22DRAFT_342350 [Leucogyrophana mollusca]
MRRISQNGRPYKLGYKQCTGRMSPLQTNDAYVFLFLCYTPTSYPLSFRLDVFLVPQEDACTFWRFPALCGSKNSRKGHLSPSLAFSPARFPSMTRPRNAWQRPFCAPGPAEFGRLASLCAKNECTGTFSECNLIDVRNICRRRYVCDDRGGSSAGLPQLCISNYSHHDYRMGACPCFFAGMYPLHSHCGQKSS